MIFQARGGFGAFCKKGGRAFRGIQTGSKNLSKTNMF